MKETLEGSDGKKDVCAQKLEFTFTCGSKTGLHKHDEHVKVNELIKH